MPLVPDRFQCPADPDGDAGDDIVHLLVEQEFPFGDARGKVLDVMAVVLQIVQANEAGKALDRVDHPVDVSDVFQVEIDVQAGKKGHVGLDLKVQGHKVDKLLEEQNALFQRFKRLFGFGQKILDDILQFIVIRHVVRSPAVVSRKYSALGSPFFPPFLPEEVAGPLWEGQ